MPERMSLAELEFSDGPNTQKVAVLTKPYHLEVRRAKIPEPRPDEMRVRVKWVGICGSDVEAYRGTRDAEFVSMPGRLGHEVAGVVDKVGAHVHGFSPGDRVVLRYVWGAFAQYVTCRPFSAKKLPENIPLIEGSLVEILPGVLHAAELGEITPSKDVLIMGQGVSGLVLTQVVKLLSPRRLAVTDLFDTKLDLARRYGATHTYKVPTPDTPTKEVTAADFPDGFDVVIPALLEGDGMVDAVDVAAQNGRIVMYGCIGKCNKTLDFFKIHRKRLDIFSTEPKRDIDNRRLFDQSITLVSDGLVNTAEMITHTYPLEQIQEAFQKREKHSPDVIHVMVDCS